MEQKIATLRKTTCVVALSGTILYYFNDRSRCSLQNNEDWLYSVLLIAIVSYACSLIYLMCNHISSRIESKHLGMLFYEFLEMVAFYYFINYRTLWLDNMPVLVDLKMCGVYQDPQNALLFYQWLHIRAGVGIYDVYRSRGNFINLVATTLLTTYVFVCLYWFSDDKFLVISVSILKSIDQWRVAWGMSALVKCVIKLGSQLTVLVQAGFFCYMMTHNAYKCWQAVETQIDQQEQDSSQVESQRLYVVLFGATFVMGEFNYISKLYRNIWLDPEEEKQKLE